MAKQPNLIFILSDQHRADWMGCAGAGWLETPNLDSLAASGVRMERCYCNSPLCGPSRMSLLSGRHPWRNEIWVNENTLSSDVPTFAHGLGLAGYHSVLAGRMHFSGPDQRHGFNERLVGDITPEYGGGPNVEWGWVEGAQRSVQESLNPEKMGEGTNPVLEFDRAVTDAAVDCLQQYAASDREAPLMLTVGWYGPHSPYACEPEMYQKALDLADRLPEMIPPPETTPHAWEQQFFERSGGLDKDAASALKARVSYAGMIMTLDRMVGQVVEAARQLDGETIIVYASDHGDLMGDYGCFGKLAFWEGSVAVPMIWSSLSGDSIPKGQVQDVPVSLLDLCPTLLELGGAPALPLQDGVSIQPLLAGSVDPEWRERVILSELEFPGYPVMRMALKGQKKYAYYHNAGEHFYDLSSDPLEQRNRVDDPACEADVSALKEAALTEWDPEQITRKALDSLEDIRLLTRWGKEIGTGPGELWGHYKQERES
ncbi:sulfatase-like hydrolase/transferase [Tichowtungia aerotolerans]|uniref:Sulfatase-like hydrolase/transferase n=1 Tax=Tichowtungia aerotolerans TaxID=2697043 RepID=A0A6P1M4V6_9BACT|nr:sulfatase-like hydrolase/transferase [Tichowtungia aerotolerans]QHI68033.1 sulfatase-like hydrolase/transferase [Tichowtungia aerotolerans]